MEKIYYIPTSKKIICLTFDDGPNNPATTIILNILKNYNVKATFFVLLENVLKNPDIMQKIIEDGHIVGLHGYTHKSFSKHPKLTVYRHIKKCLDILQMSFSVKPTYFRPPYGTLTIETETICQEFGLIPVGFTIMEKDWQPWGALRKSDYIIKKCSPGKILVMHDGYRHYQHNGTTMENLKHILPILLSQGYSFVSIPELVASRSHIPCKIFNGVPLLYHETITYGNTTYLFLYWDVNFVSVGNCACPTCGSKIDNSLYELQIASLANCIYVPLKYPSPNAMEEWHKGIKLPPNIVGPNNLFIKNNGVFVKI